MYPALLNNFRQKDRFETMESSEDRYGAIINIIMQSQPKGLQLIDPKTRQLFKAIPDSNT